MSPQPGYVLHGQLSTADEGMSAEVCVSWSVGVNVPLCACLTLPGCVSAGMCVCMFQRSDARLVEDSQ